MHNNLCRLIFGSIQIVIILLAITTSALAQTCTVSMPTIAFGNINVLAGAAINTTSTVTVTCSGGTSAGQRVCISIGAGSASDATSRQLTGPSSQKTRYDLYTDSARTLLWGSWQTGYDTAGVQLDVPQNTTQFVTVYAKFFGAQQTAVAGAYSSTFTSNPFIQYANKTTTSCPTGGKTASTSSSATATIVSSCNVSATNINFGTVGVLTSNTNATGTISVQCSSTLPYTVSLNGGNSGATDPTQRKMSFSSSSVIYGLYRDSAWSQPWGATIGTDTASGTGNGLSQNLTVYGRILAQATPPPGTYSDTIVVTITY
jgi:spore coat protein U-like protein